MTAGRLRATTFLNFRDHLFGADSAHSYRWIDLRAFVFPDGPADQLLVGLLAATDYRDDYVGGGVDPAGRVHGPYHLAAITPAAFAIVDTATADAIVDRWLHLHGPIPPGLAAEIDTTVYRILHRADTIHVLEDPGAHARHDYGWIHTEFHELVAIGPGPGEVTLIVLADD